MRRWDLHAITPAEYLDVSASVLHPLSYQQARNYNLPVEGVYLAQAGYMLERAWISSQCLITSIGSDPTPDLDACEAALCKHADGARVSVRYKALGDRHRTKTAVITIDRKWEAAGDGISSSLVMVVFDIPHLVDGVSGSYCIGVGVIVDAELGLVVVDRNTVQVSLGDVMLTFNGSEEVAARPIFSHPTQNFGVVQFDPSLISGSFTAAVLSSRETEHEDEDKDQDLQEEDSDVEGGDDNVDSDDNGKNCVGGNAEPGDAEDGGENESGGSGGNSCDGGKVTADKTAAADATAATADGDSKDKEEREAPTAGTTATPPPTAQLDSSNSSSCRKQSSAITSTAAVAGGGGSDAADTPPPLRPGDMAEFYGLTAANAPVRQRAAVVKLERLSLASSAHPQFTAHTVEVLQFDQIASCIGGLFIAVPRSDAASPSPPWTGGDAKDPSPGKRKSVPVVSAFWHSFAFSTTDGRKQTMRGLPAPVVRRAVERLRRDLLLGKAAEEEGGSSVEHEMINKQQQQQQEEEEGQEKRVLADNDSGVGVDGRPAEEDLDAAGAEAERVLAAAAAQVATAVAASAASASAAPATAAGAPEVAAAAAGAPEVAAAAAPVSRGTPRANEGAAAAEAAAATTTTVTAEATDIERDVDTAATAAVAAGDSEGGGDQEDRAGGAAPAAAAAGVSAEGSGRSLLGAAPCLPLQLVTLELSKARAGLGLSEKWSRRIERKCGERRQKQVLEVRRCMAGTPAFSVVETGDIILAVNGKLVTRFREVEVAVEEGEGSSVRLTILRELEERELTVKPSYLPTRETDRLFMWAGLMIQSPHLAVLQLGFLPKEGGGVYSSRWCYGSPAHKYSLGCTTWIVEVNGIPTPNLDAFLDVVRHIGDKSPARVKTVGLDSKVEVTTLRTDHHYWPTLELRRTGDGWTRTLHKGAPAITTSTTSDTATTADTASVSSASPETSSVASTSTPASCEIPGLEADAAEEGGKETFEDDAADPNSSELPAAGGRVAPVLGQEQTGSTVEGDKGGDIADTDGPSDEQTE
ncbi:unnamed protein product [Ectocarpus sp. CCAP 1310/34]|nr:unnamed protein product [Ectocarpus sp. CCAP 1310/34]